MGKKRKSIATSLDEVDRSLYASFCSAANSLSQVYTHAMNHQKLTFQAGERHALDKLYQWIRRQQEGGTRVTTFAILSYLQQELDYTGEDPSMLPRAPLPHQQQQHSSVSPVSSASSVPAAAVAVHDQAKNSIFSNALSSPTRKSLQPYHIAQGGYYPSGAPPQGHNGVRSSDPNFYHQNQTWDSNTQSNGDSVMADSP